MPPEQKQEVKMKNAQAEAKWVADMPPEQKQEVKMKHAHAEEKWEAHEPPEQEGQQRAQNTVSHRRRKKAWRQKTVTSLFMGKMRGPNNSAVLSWKYEFQVYLLWGFDF